MGEKSGNAPSGKCTNEPCQQHAACMLPAHRPLLLKHMQQGRNHVFGSNRDVSHLSLNLQSLDLLTSTVAASGEACNYGRDDPFMTIMFTRCRDSVATVHTPYSFACPF